MTMESFNDALAELHAELRATVHDRAVVLANIAGTTPVGITRTANTSRGMVTVTILDGLLTRDILPTDVALFPTVEMDPHVDILAVYDPPKPRSVLRRLLQQLRTRKRPA